MAGRDHRKHDPISPKYELTTAPLREADVDRKTVIAVVVDNDDDEMADELLGRRQDA